MSGYVKNHKTIIGIFFGLLAIGGLLYLVFRKKSGSDGSGGSGGSSGSFSGGSGGSGWSGGSGVVDWVDDGCGVERSAQVGVRMLLGVGVAEKGGRCESWMSRLSGEDRADGES